jgi:hypothetical protein
MTDPREAEHEQTLDEMQLIRISGAGCINGNPQEITQADVTSIPIPVIAEGVRYRFYGHNFLKAVACNFQFEYTYVNDVNRWGRSHALHEYLTDLKIISQGTADGVVFSAKYGNIEDLIVLKTPIDYSYNLSTFHEFFIGALFTNQLRQWISNFVFVLGVFRCSRPIRDPFDETKVTTYCTEHRSSKLENALPLDEFELMRQTERQINEALASGRYEEGQRLLKLIESKYSQQDIDKSLDNPINYLVLENIPNGLTLAKYVQTTSPSIPSLLGCLIQLTTALEMAFRMFDFCHYDLHTKNILLRFVGGGQMAARIGNKQRFIPIGYGRVDGSRYFIESDYIPTMIDFGRSHVRHANPINGEIKHYGYYYSVYGGIYPDRSRPAHDLYRLVGFLVWDLLIAYDPDFTDGLRQLRDSPDEDGETDEMAVARQIFRHIPEATIDFIIRLLMFFPFLNSKYWYFGLTDTLRLRIILFVYNEMESNKFSLTNDRWPEADTGLYKQNIHESFYTYLRETFPREVDQVLVTRDSLPENAVVFSCEFNQCT